MVGLVLVSHSRNLVDALIALINQVNTAAIPIAKAAGVGDERQEFGTDAMEIVEAVNSVYSDDGVLVLMDLGSAILSAEMALEFLPQEMQAHIRLCSAPFVEGAISAAVQIGIGSDLDTVYQEARQALFPKVDQLEHPVTSTLSGKETLTGGAAVSPRHFPQVQRKLRSR